MAKQENQGLHRLDAWKKVQGNNAEIIRVDQEIKEAERQAEILKCYREVLITNNYELQKILDAT